MLSSSNSSSSPQVSKTPSVQQPEWFPPTGRDTGIEVFNSLTLKKEKLVLQDDSNTLTWYTCGPTVYDWSHMGHARTYVGFDIVRRILEDYFNFNIIYIENITDIDDKIIKKSNRVCLEENIVKFLEKISNLPKSESLSKLETYLKNLKQKLEADQLEKEKSKQLTLNQLTQERDLLVQAVKEAGLDSNEVSAPDFLSVPRYYEKLFWEDMQQLQVKPPTVLVRVTEHIPEVINFIQKIIDNGFAYESEGSVYFDVDAFQNSQKHVYAKLEPWSANCEDRLLDGEGETQTSKKITKRSKKDFALWKLSQPGEPEYESKWGKGRPGWHIECSAMACYALQKAAELAGRNTSENPPVLDVHCGGIDLKFPHHDNELAQSEAYLGNRQWVNYFLHTGHLSINGMSMSKSKKNFITIREALKYYTARQIRTMFLFRTFDSEMEYSVDSMEYAKNVEKQFQEFFGNLKVIFRDYNNKGGKIIEKWSNEEFDLNNFLGEKKLSIDKALRSSFDTKTSMIDLQQLVKKTNTYLEVKNVDKYNEFIKKGGDQHASDAPQYPSVMLLKQVAYYITRILNVFGLVDSVDSFGFPVSGSDDYESNVTPIINALSEFRAEIRSIARDKEDKKEQRILKACDALRDDVLPTLGIKLEDKKDTITWKLVDKEELMREREEKLEKEKQAKKDAVSKAQSALATAEEEYQKSLIAPQDLFKTGEYASKYSEYDDKGIPTKDASGQEITKRAKKNLEKLLAKQEKLYQSQEAKKKAVEEKKAALEKAIALLSE
nr:unnamed protein product [Naegleria fowleri]